jgi:hypothetical protein
MLGINHINKNEFLIIYSRVRTAALSKRNIKSGFKVIRLILYNLEQVLSRLNIKTKTPTARNISQFPSLVGHGHAA